MTPFIHYFKLKEHEDAESHAAVDAAVASSGPWHPIPMNESYPYLQ